MALFSRTSSSTRWSTTHSRRRCWQTKGRSVWGTATRRTSPTYYRKVGLGRVTVSQGRGPGATPAQAHFAVVFVTFLKLVLSPKNSFEWICPFRRLLLWVALPPWWRALRPTSGPAAAPAEWVGGLTPGAPHRQDHSDQRGRVSCLSRAPDAQLRDVKPLSVWQSDSCDWGALWASLWWHMRQCCISGCALSGHWSVLAALGRAASCPRGTGQGALAGGGPAWPGPCEGIRPHWGPALFVVLFLKTLPPPLAYCHLAPRHPWLCHCFLLELGVTASWEGGL